MDQTTTTAPQARLFVGMGGSGIKTLAKFVDLLTEHSQESANSEVFMAYLLVDTDIGEMAEYEKKIREAYKRVHREPILRCVHLSADITDFSSFVASKLNKGDHHERLREVWWYRKNRSGKPEPFTAINLKDSPTRGAGQCPQVSTFLAWNQLRTIDVAIDELLNMLKNRSAQGKNLQNWTLDVAMVASLAGGTGRGCWHIVASKIREKLRDLNQRPKPVGFFFDSSIFAEDVKREEQVTKLRVNSITGVSELIAWLRNEYERDTDLPPYQFRLPSLENPGSQSSDLIDTTKLNVTVDGEELYGITGRAPVSAAYLVFGAGKQGTLGPAEAYYQSLASALYARLFRSTGSATINEAGHLNGLGSATISVPINGIRTYVQNFARHFLPTQYSAAVAEDKTDRVVESLLQAFQLPEGVIPPYAKHDATNVHQRVYAGVIKETQRGKVNLEQELKARNQTAAINSAKSLTSWPSSNEKKLAGLVREDLCNSLWGTYVSEKMSAGGAIQLLVPKVHKKAIDRDDTLLGRVFGKLQTSQPVNPVAEALRLLLSASEVELPTATGKEQLDIGSYGTKRAIAEKLASRLEEMLEWLANQAKLTQGAKTAATGNPSEELNAARKGFMKTSVTPKEQKAVLESVEPWLFRESNKTITTQLIHLLKNAKDEVAALARAFAVVEKQLAAKAAVEDEKTKRTRELYFWTADDWGRILDPDKSAFDKEMLSAQKLQGVARDKELQKKFHDLMDDHSLSGFEEARGKFVEAIQSWIGRQSDAESLERRKLTDVIDDKLAAMVDQFMLPADFYEATFGFFVTVKELMHEWGTKMHERAGSPQDIARLKQVFANQFGVEFPLSADKAPKELDTVAEVELARDACRAMAVRLGGRTDPLFQQRFDEGERPTYDSVAVVLPTERIFDKQFATEIDDDAKQNPQFSASGQFKATATFDMLDAGNPYTMFAYATQQFEDWRRESGMSRIASLEYYKTPAVLAWLKACEDPTGVSVFLDGEVLRDKYGIPSHRDIYGLGYISPLFLHDETLRELRWSPWDENKKRSADKNDEMLDLLAYALLDVPRKDSGNLFEHFTKVLDKAKWDMPLLTWQSSTAGDSATTWVYKRPAIRHCTEVMRTKDRDATHPAFAANHSQVSIRKCLEELHENDSVAAAIAGEVAIFMAEVLCNGEFADDFAADKDITLDFRHLGDRLASAKEQQAGPAADRMKKVIDDLLRRVAVLETYSPEQLKEHFAAIRRNSELQTRA